MKQLAKDKRMIAIGLMLIAWFISYQDAGLGFIVAGAALSFYICSKVQRLQRRFLPVETIEWSYSCNQSFQENICPNCQQQATKFPDHMQICQCSNCNWYLGSRGNSLSLASPDARRGGPFQYPGEFERLTIARKREEAIQYLLKWGRQAVITNVAITDADLFIYSFQDQFLVSGQGYDILFDTPTEAVDRVIQIIAKGDYHV